MSKSSKNRRENSSDNEDDGFTVIARDREYAILKQRVMFHIQHGGNACIYVTGVPGSGKTYTVSSLLSRIHASSIYFNCSHLKRKAAIYQELVSRLFQECMRRSCVGENNGDSKDGDHGCKENEEIANTPGRKSRTRRASRLNALKFTNGLQNLRFHLLRCTEYHIVVLDEVDFLLSQRESILYNLFELTSLRGVRVVFICISNTLGDLSSRLGSRVGSNRIDFKPYSSKQLKQIIEGTEGIDGRVVDLLAKRAASVSGDVRRVQAIIEQSFGKSLVEVNRFITSIESNLLDTFAKMLTFYHKLIIFLNRQINKNIHAWFTEFKSFCKLKDIACLDFVQFMDCVEELCKFGIFSRSGTSISSEYLEEEIVNALKHDEEISKYINDNL